MDITCIIPVHNRRTLVGNAIRSVMDQKGCGPIETVVVDDGSTDGTPQYIRSCFPQVIVVETGKNLGPGCARNLGAAHASGQVLMFLDSDDVWLPDHALLLHQALKEGFDVAYGITRTLETATGNSFSIPDEDHQHTRNSYPHLLTWCFLVPSSLAVTRRAFVQTGGFSELGFGEDWEFFLNLGRQFEFNFIEETITIRLLHEGSLCATGNISEKICMMLQRFLTEAQCRSDNAATERFSALAAHAASRGKQWHTVQDWYMSLKRHGLV